MSNSKLKLISFSLYGKRPKYAAGALENLGLARQIYPGWAVRFYLNDTVPKKIVKKLKEGGAEIIDMTGSKIPGMYWRFFPMDDKLVDLFIVRDADSRLSKREFYAVEEWVKSNKALHVMRDHPQHDVEILGGMWGFKNKHGKNFVFRKLIDDFCKERKYEFNKEDDQEFLRKLYKMFNDNLISHDEFFNFGEQKKPFPARRRGFEFVGSSYNGNTEASQKEQKLLKESLSKNSFLTLIYGISKYLKAKFKWYEKAVRFAKKNSGRARRTKPR